ncbi:hypothetical protein EDB87DRAFT_504284 [Lactarius vividus]|nr:hypothetical protein EDB87DRAFT_504284 [Lactarius vividus]
MQWSVSSSLAAIASLFLFFAGDLVVAQIIAPSCTFESSWEWSSNSLGQNPCLVTAHLMSTCYSGGFTVDPLLVVGDSYLPPTQEQVQKGGSCWCSTVILSLLSACGECQQGLSIPWTEFSQNCPGSIKPSTFPYTVPAGTRVPQWALLDITRANIWNATSARIVGDTPEILTGGTIAPHPQGSKSNTGAIAGGAAGGVVAIAAIAGLVFIFWRRQRRANVLPAVHDVSSPFPPSPLTPVRPASSYIHTQGSPITLYDPSNPSTYPQVQEHVHSTPNVNVPVSYDGYSNGSSPNNMQPLHTQGYHGLPTV